MESSQLQEQAPDKRKRIFIFALVASLLLVLLVSGAFSFFVTPTTQEDFSQDVDFTGEAPGLSPSPFPFREMTIPALREREYKSSLGERELVSENANYTSYSTSYDSDGSRVNAQLTVPKGEEPEGGFPAIIFIHGYIPPTLYQTFSNYSAYVDYLASNGFVVFKIDLRGHGDSEGEPSGAYYSENYVVDVRNAISALEKSGFVNPSRIGLWGHSMAGNVVMRTVASKQDIPAVVIWAGAVYSYEDWQKYGIEDNSYRPPETTSQRQSRRKELFDTYGEFSSQSEFWRQVAPTNYLDGLKTAIQLNHAIDDDVVNIGYSRDLVKILDEKNIKNDLNEYSSGGHNISGNSFTQAMQNTVEFFRENL